VDEQDDIPGGYKMMLPPILRGTQDAGQQHGSIRSDAGGLSNKS